MELNWNTEIYPEVAIQLMSWISNEDSDFLGFNHSRTRPEWLIIQNMIVTPP